MRREGLALSQTSMGSPEAEEWDTEVVKGLELIKSVSQTVLTFLV